MSISKFYFAYGSNMSIKRIRARTPSVKFVAVAKLAAHRLTFGKMGKDGSGKCNIVTETSSREYVLGVLYNLDVREKKVLDEIEGLGSDYLEKQVTVETLDGRRLIASVYYAEEFGSNCVPFHWYKQHVLIGAKENRFPGDYIEKIEVVPSENDPDEGRQKREAGIYL